MKRLAKRLPFLALALALLAQAPPAAPPATPPAKTSLAVYPIKPAGVTADLTAAMTALLTARLTPSPRLKVIEEAMLKTVMERQAMNISDACDDTSCQVEIGKLVKAQKMVTGTLSKIGSKYFLSTNLVDIQTGATEFSTEDKCSCSEDQLEDLIAAAVAKIRNHFGEALPVLDLPASAASGPAEKGPVSGVPGKAVVYLYRQPGKAREMKDIPVSLDQLDQTIGRINPRQCWKIQIESGNHVLPAKRTYGMHFTTPFSFQASAGMSYYLVGSFNTVFDVSTGASESKFGWASISEAEAASWIGSCQEVALSPTHK